MKSIQVLLILSMSIVSFSAFAGSEVRSKQIKKIVCKEAYKNYYRRGVSDDQCMKDKLKFSDKKKSVRLKISSQSEWITTLMYLDITTGSIDFEVTLKAKLNVNDTTGKIERTGWEVSSLVAVNYSDENILGNSWLSSSNVYELTDNQSFVPSRTLQKLENYEVDFGDINWSNDAEYGEKTLYVVKHPKTNQILGYIIEQEASSEAEDIRLLITVKLNADFEKVDESSDSWGYYE